MAEKPISVTVPAKQCEEGKHVWQVVGSYPSGVVDESFRYRQLDLVCLSCWRLAYVHPIKLSGIRR